MKIFISVMAILSVLLTVTACGGSTSEQSADMFYYLEETLSEAASETSKISEKSSEISEEENTEMKIKLEVGGSEFTVVLEENKAADAFAEMMKNEAVTIEMSDYSGFEKVGALGKNLPASDSQTTTKSGDIVLYQGNKIVIFYGSNSWSYTRLGHIDDLTGWEEALGSGDVTAVFSVEK